MGAGARIRPGNENRPALARPQVARAAAGPRAFCTNSADNSMALAALYCQFSPEAGHLSYIHRKIVMYRHPTGTFPDYRRRLGSVTLTGYI